MDTSTIDISSPYVGLFAVVIKINIDWFIVREKTLLADRKSKLWVAEKVRLIRKANGLIVWALKENKEIQYLTLPIHG